MHVQVTAIADADHRRMSSFLGRDPVANTVLLGILAGARVGREPAGSWCAVAVADGEVVGAALRTPPFGVALAEMDDAAARALGAALADRELPGAMGRPTAVAAFAAGAGRRSAVHMRELQYVLRELLPPRPVAGAARDYEDRDESRYVDWMARFFSDTGLRVEGDAMNGLRTRLAAGGRLVFWEVDGEPVSMAGRSPTVAGVPRIGPVFTPADQRGRGYAAAVTAHVCADALDLGATAVTLFTDAANPTSNGVYRRLGFAATGEFVDAVFDLVPTG